MIYLFKWALGKGGYYQMFELLLLVIFFIIVLYVIRKIGKRRELRKLRKIRNQSKSSGSHNREAPRKTFSNRHISEVEQSSVRYQELLKLNRKYEFHDIDTSSLRSIMNYHVTLNSKRDFDLYDKKAGFKKYYQTNKIKLKPIVQKMYLNDLLYSEYMDEYSTLPKYGLSKSMGQTKMSKDVYSNVEKELCERSMLPKPYADLNIKHIWSYTSPKGRNSYKLHEFWTLDDFMFMVDKVVKVDGKFISEEVYKRQKLEEKEFAQKQHERKLKKESEAAKKRKKQKLRHKEQWYLNEIDRVNELSVRYQALKQLQDSFEFVPITKEDVNIILHEQFDTRAKVENYEFDLEDFLRYVYDNKEELKDVINKLNVNSEIAEDYYSKILKLPPYGYNFDKIDSGLTLDQFKRVEKKICSELELDDPITDMKMTYYVTYISPKGRSQMQKKKTYSMTQIEYALEHVDTYKYAKQRKKKLKSNFIKEQRSIAAGLRYDVLTRDEHRCQICGIKAIDGDDVVLHVDHIKPVSLGGKSVMENLRTLCSRCNLGKSAKYNPNGIN